MIQAFKLVAIDLVVMIVCSAAILVVAAIMSWLFDLA